MVGVVSLLACIPAAPALADALQQDFSRTSFKLGVHDALPRPQILSEETAHARFLRLAWSRLNNHNSLSFQRSDAGPACEVTADFDFRMQPGSGRADGLGFALLDTGTFGVARVVAPTEAPSVIAEEPNFLASLGIGFDIYPSGPPDLNGNHVSVHFDGATVAQFDAGPNLDLGNGDWIHAAITVNAALGSVDVTLTPEGGNETPIATGLLVQGLAPYESRVWFGARTGGENADFDLDNVAVVFTPCPPPITLGRLP